MFTLDLNLDRLNNNPILSHSMKERDKKEKIGQFYCNCIVHILRVFHAVTNI